MEQITPRELSVWLADSTRVAPLLIDVREGWEVDLCRLDGARHIPMGNIPGELQSLPDDVPIVVYCHHGIRSAQVGAFLERQGWSQIFNLKGGIDAWAYDVAVGMAKY